MFYAQSGRYKKEKEKEEEENEKKDHHRRSPQTAVSLKLILIFRGLPARSVYLHLRQF